MCKIISTNLSNILCTYLLTNVCANDILISETRK
nr:MAG TPA: hypothetical protein [Caudoviricetes sp.]